MDAYINFLKSAFPNWEITKELNVNWDGKKTVGIFKSATGTNFVNSSVIPFQLIILTDDVPESLNVLNAFISTQQEKFFVNNYVWYKQYFYTPVVPTIATATGNTLTSQIIVSGIITISDNLSDIAKVEISVNSGISYETYITQVRDIGYSTEGTSQVFVSSSDDYIGKRNNKAGSVIFNISVLAQNNNFLKKLRELRVGTLNPNTVFKVKFTFTDTNVVGTQPASDSERYYEIYDCKVVNYQYHSENSQLPNYVITLQTC